MSEFEYTDTEAEAIGEELQEQADAEGSAGAPQANRINPSLIAWAVNKIKQHTNGLHRAATFQEEDITVELGAGKPLAEWQYMIPDTPGETPRIFIGSGGTRVWELTGIIPYVALDVMSTRGAAVAAGRAPTDGELAGRGSSTAAGVAPPSAAVVAGTGGATATGYPPAEV